MHNFLTSIANGYKRLGKDTLGELTFVFPNLRSAKFFRRELKGAVDNYRLKTLCITLTELIEKSCGRTRLGKERLLFMLYAAYRKVMTDTGREADIKTFDRFRFWGEMILRDFSDADMYMANVRELFRNVEDYKEIQTFYLTDEQKHIISEYWGEDPYWNDLWRNADQGELPFWNHLHGNSHTEKKFKQLWQLLWPVYKEFRAMLDRENACYTGLATRLVAEKLLAGQRLPLNPRTFVFVGFSRLSTAESVIFEQLDRRDLAHFYWEYDPRYMGDDCGSKAGRFISRYAAKFTSALPGLELPAPPQEHRVDVIGVPSNAGQAKVAATLLSEPETAVVLASEDLLLPMAHAIPADTQVNVTMGYPMRYSSLAQFFALLMSLQLRSRTSNGVTRFFHDDVEALLASPMVQAVFAPQCRSARELMRGRRLYNLPSTVAAEAPEFEPLRPLLTPIDPDSDMQSVADYVERVLDFAEANGIVNALDVKCMEIIRKQMDEIMALSAEFDVSLQPHTFLQFIERTVIQRSVALEGQTFSATQVMGVLETRCLGFDNVVMLSMSDTVFPGRYHGTSFIPETLRLAYGLPGREHREVEAAYHFYRLLSNARHLTLLYDSRSEGLRSGEMSRFIFQLRYLDMPGVTLNMKMASFAAAATRNQAPIGADVEVTKTPEIMERLNRYRNGALLKSYSLSASSIKHYLNCPLSFYFERVQDIRPEDEDIGDVNAGMFGNVVHETLERVYLQLRDSLRGPIDRNVLQKLTNGGFDDLLEREIHNALCFNIDNVDRNDPEALAAHSLSDMARAHTDIVRDYIMRIIGAEETPFEFIDAERSRTFVWRKMGGEGIDVNFTMKIDRVDRLDGTTRLIDYKTGSDKSEFAGIGSLVKERDPAVPRAVFQLLTYCEAFLQLGQDETDASRIRPQIYAVRELRNGGFPRLCMNKHTLESYEEVRAEFRASLTQVIHDIFDPDIPFRRATDERCCTFCRFYSWCHVNSKPKRNF